MNSENLSLPSCPDFDQLANLLVAEGVYLVSPAELHGLFSGLLAAGGRLAPDALLKTATELMDVPALQHEASKVGLIELYEATLAGLQAAELAYDLLLPDDSQALAQRSEALGGWCQSFLSGFGLFGRQTDASLSAEVRETLSDLNQIAQIATDVEDDEDSEADLMEVQEYVRMAALMLFAEFNRAAQGPAGQGTLH